MDLETCYKNIRTQLKQANIENAAHEARYLISYYAGIDQSNFISDKDLIINKEALQAIEMALERRIAGEPLTRILGVREFWGLEFEVTPDTLDPRPDTETLIEAALKWVEKAGLTDKPIRILDMGTGTGCIPISMLSELPHATAIATDISPKALDVARKNAEKNKMSRRIEFIESDWMSALQGEQFDLILSNPPYISESVINDLSVEVKNHDPILALSGGEDGLECYKKIIFDLKNHLNQHNRAFLEIGFDQLESLKGLVEESGLCLSDSYADISGIPRVVEISNGDK